MSSFIEKLPGFPDDLCVANFLVLEDLLSFFLTAPTDKRRVFLNRRQQRHHLVVVFFELVPKPLAEVLKLFFASLAAFDSEWVAER
jgi:hypothetical protein